VAAGAYGQGAGGVTANVLHPSEWSKFKKSSIQEPSVEAPHMLLAIHVQWGKE